MAGACLMLVVLFFLAALVHVAGAAKGGNGTCDSPSLGFQCHPTISHFWGQYSPFFSVPSEIDASLPKRCEITFVQVLSRHGARDPTGGKSKLYNATIDRIHRDVENYGTGFEFIKDYQYRLGADQLTDLGRSQMINSGISFYERYRRLAQDNTPFIRASGQDRVIESGVKWAAGFHQARVADRIPPNDGFPYPIFVIPEEDGVNNTLDHSLCTAFERSTEGDEAQAQFLPTFGESVRDRLNQGLPGANLSMAEGVYLMELCPFETVANPDGKLSKFCGLFGEAEWASYDYLQTLGKYYGYGPGSPLGPTQGVGLVNELVARLTDNPVQDHTSTNSTLDSDPATFPLGRRLYADFSHDNDMTTVYAALGLYNATIPLPKTERRGPEDLAGYAASWTVPFAARMYVEKMKCDGKEAARADGNEEGEEEELVRILVNDRVIPLQNCGADVLGRCALSKFVGSLGFARGGGHWDQCFV